MIRNSLKMIADHPLTGAGPVSYTHLRAHETVLDLVCRLLLEKKQPNNTKPHDCITPQNETDSLLLTVRPPIHKLHSLVSHT